MLEQAEIYMIQQDGYHLESLKSYYLTEIFLGPEVVELIRKYDVFHIH